MMGFSKEWKASKKPGKQRKYRYNAPLHIRKVMVSVNLSPELRKKHNKRSLPIHIKDKVKVVRGDFKGKQGNVKSVDLKTLKVTVDGVERTKRDGTKAFPKIDPSNLMLIELQLEDKMRQKILNRKIANKEIKNAKKTS